MLRRLLAVLVTLLLLFAAVLTLPLARMVADSATQTVYTDRLADADRYATLAGRALTDGRTAALADELHQYTLVFGGRAWLLGVDGTTKVSGDGSDPPPQVLSAPEVDLAERGVRPDPQSAVSPTGGTDLLVAVPVGAGAEAIGALVTLSPVDKLRRRIAERWALLGVVAVLITLALVVAAVPFTRWLLRPVARLDAAAGEIAAGRLESRVGLAAGPPELRRLAGSFDRMAAVVERTLQRQQQFVGDASHQLRTPLTSLRLALDNLGPLLPPEPEDPARQEYHEAMEEVRAMGRLFDGLLALTRLGSEPVEAEDVDQVLADARVGWQAHCTAAGLRLELSAPPGLRVLAPPGGLRHLLDELVENACRLSGGELVEVGARAVKPGTVELTVRDDGRGMDAEQRRMATRRFWRATDQQNAAGSGLGLAIVLELVAAVGGSVQLLDAAPGLEVALALPAAPTSRRDHALRGDHAPWDDHALQAPGGRSA
jgi:signal transduction histidine kinase